MSTARECPGCCHYQWTSRIVRCAKYDRVYHVGKKSRLVAREHDPGRCWEAKEKLEKEKRR